jgi:transposase
MSRMPDSKGRRPRRQFDEEFKAQAVRLVLQDGKSVGAVARDLDLTESALRQWVERARVDRTRGRTGLTTAEREELARLRKENRELRTERDILKNESRALTSPTCGPETPWRTLTRPRPWPFAFW